MGTAEAETTGSTARFRTAGCGSGASISGVAGSTGAGCNIAGVPDAISEGDVTLCATAGQAIMHANGASSANTFCARAVRAVCKGALNGLVPTAVLFSMFFLVQRTALPEMNAVFVTDALLAHMVVHAIKSVNVLAARFAEDRHRTRGVSSRKYAGMLLATSNQLGTQR